MIVLKQKFKQFSYGLRRINGRLSQTGQIIIYYRGSGVKRLYRKIDFAKLIWNVKGFVMGFVYDTLRASVLCLIGYLNGVLSYITTPVGLNVGDYILNGQKSNILKGSSTFLNYLNVDTLIYNICFSNFKIICSPGSSGRIVSRKLTGSLIKLPSGKTLVCGYNLAVTVGAIVAFRYCGLNSFRKAGTIRKLGWRPNVRGVAMNPVDHPHGGGEGKSSGGRPSVSRWGWITK